MQFTRAVFKNGLRVVMAPMPGNLATTAIILVEAGSKYETKDINGLSHFLEHMCFQGTKKRKTSLDVTNELNNIGAEFNAFTTYEQTGYHVKARNNDIEVVLDVLSDMYINPKFEEKEIEREKGVVVEEMKLNDDIPKRRVADVFMELMYGREQPAGWRIEGHPEIVRALTRENILQYRSKFYLAPATTLVLAGGFDQDALLPKIENYFSEMPAGEKGQKLPVKEEQGAPGIKLQFKESDQTHLILGVRAYNMFDKRRYALGLLGDILGASFGSRLFERLRNEMGVAYYVGAGAEMMTDHGFLEAAAGVDNTRFLEATKAIIEEMKRLADQKVPADELQRTKNRIAGNTVLGLETSEAVAMFYGDQEHFGRPIETPEEMLEKLTAVTAEDIQNVAQDILKNDRLNLAVIGPHKESEELRKILSF